MKTLILFLCYIPILGIIFQEYFLQKYFTTENIYSAFKNYVAFFFSVIFQLFYCIIVLVYIIKILL